MKLTLTAVLISAIGVQVPLWAAAPQPATEAPAGFDTPTLVKAPGSMSVSNGIIEPSGDQFALDQQVYETQHDVTTGLGPVNKLRTAPLWGLRMRPRYMHDLKSLTLQNAIERHEGEAEHVVRRFRDLTDAQKKDVLTFLESL